MRRGPGTRRRNRRVRLEGKVAVIAGAATGIGRATAVVFGKEGARVVFGDVNDAEAEETLRLVRATGADAQYVHCDVRQDDDVRRLTETAVDAFGRLDVMMNNVGVNFFGKVHETSEEAWAHCLNLNLGGVYRGMKHAIPHMLAQGGGSIVNTASNQGLVAFNGFAAYAAAKGAIVQLTRQAAFDYAPDQIRINCICPGAVRTPMNPEMMDPSLDGGARLARSASRIPLGRVAEPEDIAYAALYLASDESSMVTGHVMVVDGGVIVKGP
ncbi:MAG: SDR family oxidoreductase [Chloroflexi bacterium]|nr:SDR family oxidoreductase [Chloroflexota bacterium]